MSGQVMARLNQRQEQAAAVAPGDSVRVHVKIKEGDKERIQVFAGTVIARRGRGATATFTVRRVSHGVGVERIFPLQSPHIAKVEVEQRARVRRAKLYYLRARSGKRSRLKSGAEKKEASA